MIRIVIVLLFILWLWLVFQGDDVSAVVGLAVVIVLLDVHKGKG
jgi:hypothetical protein